VLTHTPWGNIECQYYCLTNGPELQEYLGPNLQNGGVLVFGRQHFVTWAYQKTHQTPFPGKGNVTVFAGTLSYRIDSPFPGVSFPGGGSASIKCTLTLITDNGSLLITGNNATRTLICNSRAAIDALV
jgi:hypothetical protein